MSKKNLKRSAALMLAATMAVGSAMTVFAADDGVAEGDATYEGTKDAAIPLVQITVPTDAQMQDVYDYVADPNDLIKDAKDHGRLGTSATIDADAAGILFQYDTSKYGKTSKKLEVESQNYKDVDVTVELKVKDGAKGDADIVYADSSTFAADDKDKKLYLAVTDAAASDPTTVALPESGVVKLTQTAEGKPANYELEYNTTDSKYEYKAKSSATGWDKVGFALTGAINKNATWDKDATFPTLVVTWSFAEHKELEAQGSVSGGVAWLSPDGSNGFSAAPTSVTKNGTAVPATGAGAYTYDDAGWLSLPVASGDAIVIVVAGATYTYTAP